MSAIICRKSLQTSKDSFKLFISIKITIQILMATKNVGWMIAQIIVIKDIIWLAKHTNYKWNEHHLDR